MSTDILQAGVARTIITPPVGSPMRGFAGRAEATAVHDELSATALVLRSGDAIGAIVGIDLCLFSRDEALAWRERVADRVGIPVECQAHNASHTHYGPEQTSDDPVLAGYQDLLTDRIAEAVEQAAGGLQPVHLAYGVGTTDIGINRRETRSDGKTVLGFNFAGQWDRDALVLRLDTAAGEPLATVVNIACHAVCGGSRSRELSACWPGVMRRTVEQATGSTVVFLQGGGANINSLMLVEGHEVANQLGARAGGQVLDVWRGLNPAPAAGLAVRSRVVDLPRYRYGSLERAEAELARHQRVLDDPQAGRGQKEWAERNSRFAAEVVRSYHGEATLEPLQCDLTGWRIGPVSLGTAAGEIFWEVGHAVRQFAPTHQALFAGYTNGSIGYVPIPAAYPIGGYEVDMACRVDPPAAGIVVSACGDLLREAWAAVGY